MVMWFSILTYSTDNYSTHNYPIYNDSVVVVITANLGEELNMYCATYDINYQADMLFVQR
jgi:hypothetical protein